MNYNPNWPVGANVSDIISAEIITRATAVDQLAGHLGDRDATRCGDCGRHLAAIEPGIQRFELEDAATGSVLCDVCSNRRHHPLRLAVALLNAMVEAYNAGNQKAATGAVEAITGGFQMLQDEAPRVAYRRPVRQQPVRPNRRGRRR